MKQSGIAGERLVGLILLALLLLNPPFILIFDRPSTIAGFPVLYLYLFIAWAILIALLAIVTELSVDTEVDKDEQGPRADTSSQDDPESVR